MNPADHNETQDDAIGLGVRLAKVNEDSLQMRAACRVIYYAVLTLGMIN
jgi:hypothetical protein